MFRVEMLRTFSIFVFSLSVIACGGRSSTPVAIEIDFPLEGALYNGQEITVAGHLIGFESLSGIPNVEITLGDISFPAAVNGDGSWRLESFPLETIGSVTLTATVSDADNDLGERTLTFQNIPSGPALSNAVYSPLRERIYTYSNEAQSVLELSPKSNEMRVSSSSDIGTGPRFDERGGAVKTGVALYTNSNNVDVILLLGRSTLLMVDPTTGDREWLTNSDVGGGPLFYAADGIAVDSSTDTAFVSNLEIISGEAFHSIYSVNLISGDRQLIYGASVLPIHRIRGAGGITFDDQSGLLYIGDDESGEIVAINPATRTKNTISSEIIGEGPLKLFSPNSKISLSFYSHEGTRILIAGRWNNNEIYGINLDSGNRIIIDDMALNNAGSRGVFGLTVNELSNEIYATVGFGLNKALYRVAPQESVSEILSLLVGGGEPMRGAQDMAFRPSTQQLYFSAPNDSRLVSIDFVSNLRSLALSSVKFSTIAWNEANDMLFFSYQNNGFNLYSFDIVTGDAISVINNSVDFSNVIEQVIFSDQGDKAYLLTGPLSTIVELDLRSGIAKKILSQQDITSINGTNSKLSAIAFDSISGDVFAIGEQSKGNAIFRINPITKNISQLVSSEETDNYSFRQIGVVSGELFVLTSKTQFVRTLHKLNNQNSLVEVSGANIGRGPSFRAVSSSTPEFMAIDKHRGRVFIRISEDIFMVDVATGDRVVLAR